MKALASGLLLGLLLALLLAPVPAQAAITEFPVPTAASHLGEIAAGPDGALWFTEEVANNIGRIATDGTITEYPCGCSEPVGITAGPDGALWFTEFQSGNGNGAIGRITTAGTVTNHYALPTANSEPYAITAGPDGALWFAEEFANQIGRITTSGSIKEFPVPTPQVDGVLWITPGPGAEQALWFTEGGTGVDKVARITTAGTITEFPTPTPGGRPWGIAVGPDGALWFTELSGNKVGRLTTGGTVTNEFAVLTPESEPWSIATGPDLALWFLEKTANSVGRVTQFGAIGECPIPTPTSEPEGITRGPDGALWFTEQKGNKIGRITSCTATAPTHVEIRLTFGTGPEVAGYASARIEASVTEAGLQPTGVPLTFTVTGANAQAGSSTTREGQAAFSYTGNNAGTDHIVASFVDKLGRTFTSNAVTQTWTASPPPGLPLPAKTRAFKAPLPAPVLGKAVNAETVSGVVFVKLPAGAHLSVATQHLSLAARLLWAFESLSKGAGFIPLSEARQIPVGSTLDTTAGVARVTTATATSGKVQFGDFGAGIFTILQNRKQRGLTNLNIVNTQSPRRVCATIGKKAQAASKHLSSRELGRLKGSAHGKFTTRGQYSAATVRGTIWSVTNRCDGTLTQVTRGMVSVRDFLGRKTLTLRAGQRYLAEAP
jgi:virginiamycin B lyase